METTMQTPALSLPREPNKTTKLATKKQREIMLQERHNLSITHIL
jgi:hypothetical protein